jgi:hypothetical protein
MAGILKVYNIGAGGVNVDSDPIALEDQELRLAQNAIRDPLGTDSGLKKRPGLALFNTLSTGGPILGGIPVAFSATGGGVSPHIAITYLFIGRSTT